MRVSRAQAVSAVRAGRVGRAGSVSRARATCIEKGLRWARVNKHLEMLYDIL